MELREQGPGAPKTLVVDNWIDGRARPGTEYFERRNPANRDDLVTVAPVSSAGDVHEACVAARQAQAAWCRVPAPGRAQVIARLRTLLTPDNIAATPGLALFGEVGDAASKLGLSELELELEDLGAVERANRLRARYEIANGEAENSEESHAGFMAEACSLCERDLQAAFINDDACERLAEFAAAERDSLQFSASGTSPLTFDEFLVLNRRGPEYLRTEFKPKLK